MNLSIKNKLILYMTMVVVFFALVLIIGNKLFVEKYYLEKKKNDLMESANEISKYISEYDIKTKEDINDDFIAELMNYQSINGQNIVMASSDGDIYFPSFEFQDIMFPNVTISSAIPSVEANEYTGDIMENRDIYNGDIIDDYTKVDEITEETQMLTGDTRIENRQIDNEQEEKDQIIDSYAIMRAPKNEIQIFTEDEKSLFTLEIDARTEQQYLSYQKLLEGGIILSTSMSMATINDGVEIINDFIVLITLATIVLTLVYSIIVSARFTKPLTIISHASKKMKELDFGEKIIIKGNDEISELAENINSLSDTLDKTIFELNEKNETLEADLNKEKEIEKRRREFISSVSHELKTPIFLIQGYADGLIENIANDEKRDFYCSVISEESERMNLLVQDLLNITKMEIENNDYKFEKIKLNCFVEEILVKYKIMFEEDDINLNLELLEIDVEANKDKLEIVFNNFISNAIEHLDEKKVISIKTKKKDAKVKISIFNSGEKIEAKEFEHLWESFYKLDKSRTREIGGAGLGLSIVKAILDNHKSEYGIENKKDGVEFYFTLDIKE